MFINFNAPPTGQIVLPTIASFSAPDPDGDINLDGEIDIFDVVIVVKNVGKEDFNPRTDMNEDGKVDNLDTEIIQGLLT